MRHWDVALGDGEEARQAGLAGQQVVVAGVELPFGDAKADREELAGGLEEEAELHAGRESVGGPGHTYQAPLAFDPVRVAGVPRTFVDCTRPPLGTIDVIRKRVRDPRFWDGAWVAGGGVRVLELATGHDPMVTAPDELTQILLEAAGL